jgi:hypothetical protein
MWLLQALAEPSWVEGPFGLSAHADTDGTGEDATNFDERGVHFTYRPCTEPEVADIRASRRRHRGPA